MINREKNMFDWKAREWAAFYIAVAVVLIVGVAASFYPASLDTEFIMRESVYLMKDFCAEQDEKLMYVLCTIVFPVAFFCAYHCLQKTAFIASHAFPTEWFRFTPLVVIPIVILTRLDCFDFARKVAQGGAHQSYAIIALAFIIGMIVFVFLMMKKRQGKYGWYLPATLAVSLLIAWTYITTTYLFGSNTYHCNAYLASVYKVMHGYTLFIDFNSLYGQYAYVLAPLAKLLGGTELSFSILMAGCVFVICTCWAGTLRRVIKNRAVAFCGFGSAVYIAFVYFRLRAKYMYLQYIPHRMLFPSLILYCAAVESCRAAAGQKYRAVKAVGYTLCAFGLFWNIETGLICLLAFMLLQLYLYAQTYDLKDRQFWMKALEEAGWVAACLVAFAAATWIVACVRTGVSISIVDTLTGIFFFSSKGFFMIRMKLLHPWLLPVLLYMSALAESIRHIRCFAPEKTPGRNISAMLFFLPVLGIGLFSYYEGRSHNNCLVLVLYPAALLFSVYCDILLDRYHNEGWKRLSGASIWNRIKANIYAVYCACFGGALIALCLLLAFTFATNRNMQEALVPKKAVESPYAAIKGALLERSIEADQVDFLITDADLLYCNMEKATPMPVAAKCDWLLWSEVDRVIAYLEISDRPYVLIESGTEALLDKHYGIGWKYGLEQEELSIEGIANDPYRLYMRN